MFLLVFIFSLSAQEEGVTIKLNKLSKPKEFLTEYTVDSLYRRLPGRGYHPNILIQSHHDEELARPYGNNLLYATVYEAYANHRPLVLSPDVIWLAIAQGFAHHVNANAETLRHHFVNFEEKKTLTVEVESPIEELSSIDWSTVFGSFNSHIAAFAGQECVDVLTADFSTTGEVEKIASQITIKKAMESYFDYNVMLIACGIPEITLLGTTADWEEIVRRVKYLERYQTQFWNKELIPVLEEFVRASKGEADVDFWKKILVENVVDGCGASYVDGWILKFFPYDKAGNMMSMKHISPGAHTLPSSMMEVTVLYQVFNDRQKTLLLEEKELEVYAGFLGVEQNKTNYALTPKIAWMVRYKDSGESEQRLKELEEKKRWSE